MHGQLKQARIYIERMCGCLQHTQRECALHCPSNKWMDGMRNRSKAPDHPILRKNFQFQFPNYILLCTYAYITPAYISDITYEQHKSASMFCARENRYRLVQYIETQMMVKILCRTCIFVAYMQQKFKMVHVAFAIISRYVSSSCATTQVTKVAI